MLDPLVADPLDLFRALAEAHDGIAVKGKKMPYCATNGNMFAFLSPSGELCFRFAPGTEKEVRARHGLSEPVMQYGAVMKGYVSMPLADVTFGDLEVYFSDCVAEARALPPKPTKRR